MAWQYDVNAALKISHRVYQNEAGIHILLQVKENTVAKWKYVFFNQRNYESKAHEKVEPLRQDTLGGNTSGVIIDLLFPKMQEDLLVVRIAGFDQKYYYDIGTKIGNISFPSFFPVNTDGLPILKSYINLSDHRWSDETKLYFMRYREDFNRADPPMASMKQIAPRATLDSTFLTAAKISFKDGFFYTVRSDSNASSGVTMLKVPPYFPEYRRLPELVESMLYITSEIEEKAIKKSKNLKKDFDSFWINNFNTRSKARNEIRKYYESVKKANILFTDYKPGWKTDRGMLLIIYGTPDKVYRLNGMEEWHYDAGEVFEFSVISTFFAPRTYSLLRDKGYEDSWFRKVREIRRGVNE